MDLENAKHYTVSSKTAYKENVQVGKDTIEKVEKYVQSEM